MRPTQHGLTLVELLVGMAIGLAVTAMALTALTQHLRASQQLLVEARLMQDLRTVTELLTRDLRRAGPLAASADEVRFQHPDHPDEHAYRMQGGVIEMKIGSGHWQAMTDVQTMRVSALRVVPRTQEIALETYCARPCSPGDTQCPPRLQTRSIDLDITVRATHDASVTRSSASTVQLRHDALLGACPA